MRIRLIVPASLVLLLAGCATVPTGPNVMALPGQGRNFDEFRTDDMVCRDYAYQQIGGAAREQAAANAQVGSAALGTMLGALAGAAIGGHNGAGVGAGAGLLIGSATAADSAHASLRGGQRQYDMAYVQCMYAKGHRVPLNGSYSPTSTAPAAAAMPPPPPTSTANRPPPPPGTPPPPPPTR